MDSRPHDARPHLVGARTADGGVQAGGGDAAVGPGEDLTRALVEHPGAAVIPGDAIRTSGAAVVLIGPSGSGKTTLLLRCISHLETLDAGVVTVDGATMGVERRPDGHLAPPRSGKTIAKQRSEIGMVFQLFNLFPHRTAVQNINEVVAVKEDLARGGMTMVVVTHEMRFDRDLVKSSVCSADSDDFAEFNAVYAACFAEPRPVRTTIGVGVGKSPA